VALLPDSMPGPFDCHERHEPVPGYANHSGP
jgi:hypothetical protein